MIGDIIKAKLIARGKDFYIDLKDVAITHLSFGRKFMNAIEYKQVAQIEAERQKFIVLKN